MDWSLGNRKAVGSSAEVMSAMLKRKWECLANATDRGSEAGCYFIGRALEQCSC